MSEHDEFLRQATLCVSMMASIDDPGQKATLLEMAQKWRDLAIRASHRETKPPSPGSERGEKLWCAP